jgi:hypothetical protein
LESPRPNKLQALTDAPNVLPAAGDEAVDAGLTVADTPVVADRCSAAREARLCAAADDEACRWWCTGPVLLPEAVSVTGRALEGGEGLLLAAPAPAPAPAAPVPPAAGGDNDVTPRAGEPVKCSDDADATVAPPAPTAGLSDEVMDDTADLSVAWPAAPLAGVGPSTPPASVVVAVIVDADAVATMPSSSCSLSSGSTARELLLSLLPVSKDGPAAAG